MKIKFVTLIAVFLLMSPYAFALSLEGAKSNGFLGETPSGYLEAVTPAVSQEVLALMREINGKRRNEYEAIAKKNGTALEAVEALAGKKAIEKTAPGNYVKVNQNWVKK